MRAWFVPLIIALVLATAAVRAEASRDGLADYLEGCLARGDRAAVEEMVRALERTTLPDTTGRADLVEAFLGVFTARSETGWERRIRRLPAPVRPVPLASARPLEFPRDHGAHPTSLVEWWYFNGHVRCAGRSLGYMITFFKTLPEVNFVHVALTDKISQAHPLERRFYRASQVATATGRLDVKFGPHTLTGRADGTMHLAFDVAGRRLELDLEPEREPMMVNGDGVIDMPEGTTSRYYSVTRCNTTGTLRGAGGRTDAVTGRSWFDHQWGNFVALFRPWDWFCFQMDDGTDYNLFHFRKGLAFGGRTCVNVLDPHGRLTVHDAMEIRRVDWWKSPRSGQSFVTRWTLGLTALGEQVEVSTPVADQEMPRLSWLDIPPAYWEGVIQVTRRTSGGATVHGVGYGEHFPYRHPRPAPRAP